MLQKLEPFLIGGIMAFVLNVPLTFIEKKCLGFIKGVRFKRVLAILSSLVLLFFITACLLFLFVPKIIGFFGVLWGKIPDLYKMLANLCVEEKNSLQGEIGLTGRMWNVLLDKLIRNLPAVFSQISVLFTGLTDFFGNMLGHLTDFGMGIVFAVYLLLYKEAVLTEVVRALDFWLPDETAEFVKLVFTKWYELNRRFLVGQCMESVIFGSMFCIVLNILRIPYANLISIIMTVSALVPIIGPFIGSLMSAALVVTVSPFKMLIFWMVYFVIQQVEDNLIYPKVVGNSVGLPPFLIFFAVLLGHKIAGIIGILLLIPMLATVYYICHDKNCCNFLKKNKNST